MTAQGAPQQWARALLCVGVLSLELLQQLLLALTAPPPPLPLTLTPLLTQQLLLSLPLSQMLLLLLVLQQLTVGSGKACAQQGMPSVPL